MATIEQRLAALREYLKNRSADEIVFIVEGGKEFRTKQDAFTSCGNMALTRQTGGALPYIRTQSRV